MPPKPQDLETCHLDVPEQICRCGTLEKPEEIVRHPIEYCDKATAFRPEHNEKRRNYEKSLEDTLRGIIEKGETYR